MPEQNPIADALETSVIINRKDVVGQTFWTEWRQNAVHVGGTPAQAYDVVLLGPDGKIDPSLLPSTGSGHIIQVNGVSFPQEPILNFVGSSVSGMDDPINGKTDITITATGSGVNVATAEIDFGFSAGNEGDIARMTVPATWVVADSIILCQAALVSTPDHDPEDAAIENIQVWVENLVPGVSFDVIALAPQNSWGRYYIQVLGS